MSLLATLDVEVLLVVGLEELLDEADLVEVGAGEEGVVVGVEVVGGQRGECPLLAVLLQVLQGLLVDLDLLLGQPLLPAAQVGLRVLHAELLRLLLVLCNMRLRGAYLVDVVHEVVVEVRLDLLLVELHDLGQQCFLESLREEPQRAQRDLVDLRVRGRQDRDPDQLQRCEPQVDHDPARLLADAVLLHHVQAQHLRQHPSRLLDQLPHDLGVRLRALSLQVEQNALPLRVQVVLQLLQVVLYLRLHLRLLIFQVLQVLQQLLVLDLEQLLIIYNKI